MTGPRAVTWLAVRQVRRGALVVALLCAGLSGLVAVQYRTTVAGMDVVALETLAQNPAVRTLFGPARALDDAGGFTVWRTGPFVAVLAAAWTFLAATRITRGEEDAGRWALLLAGTVGVRQVVVRHLAVLLAADLLVAVLLAAALAVAGTSPNGAVLHGAGVGLVAAAFAGLGVLAAQVLPDRRSAAAVCAAVLVAGLLLRMVADGVAALARLSWLSPFGLLAEIRPYAGDRPLPALVLALAATAFAAAAAGVAGRRDDGDAPLRRKAARRPRLALLGSLPGFLLRRTLRPWLAWAGGLAAYFLLIGLLAESLTQFLTENAVFAELAAQAGFDELGTVQGYAASLFRLLAIPVGLFAAARVAADVADEDAGRLMPVFAAPVSRVRWLAVHAGLLLVACLALCGVAGTATWAGARWADAPLTLAEALAGAANALPVAGLSLGAALLALGWVPHAVLAAGAVPVGGGFVLLSLADSLSWPTAVRALSPFAHVASVPAREPALTAAATMLAIAAASATVGAIGYARRDVASGPT